MSRTSGRDGALDAGRVESVERGEYDGAVGIAQRRGDDLDAVLRGGRRRGSYERHAPARIRVRERGGERGHRCVAETCDRRRGAAGRSRLTGGRDDARDDFRLGGVGWGDRVERRDAHRRVGVLEKSEEQCTIRRQPGLRQGRRGSAPIHGRARFGEVARERPGGGGRSRVAERGEVDQRAHAHLRVRVLGDPMQLRLRGRRREARKQIQPEPHVAGVIGPEQRVDRRHVIEIVARPQRTAAHRVAERVSVRAVDADGDGGPQHRQDETERDHRLDAEVERVEDEEEHARGADRDRDPDALDDRLHRESLVGPDHLVGRR